METIYYDINIYNYDILGKGAFSTVYYDKEKNKAIKIYSDDFDEKERMIDLNNEEKIAKLTFLKEYNVVLPEEKVYVNDEYLGITMNIVNGYTLNEYYNNFIYSSNLIPKINFFLFFKSLKKLKNNISFLSSKNIEFFDLNDSNIMWDIKKKDLFIIDTQLIFENKTESPLRLKEDNLKRLNEELDIKRLIKNQVFTFDKE